MSLITRIIKPKPTGETLEERVASLPDLDEAELIAVATTSSEVKLQESAIHLLAYGQPLLDLALGDHSAKVNQAARQRIGELLENNKDLIGTLVKEPISQTDLINLTVHSPTVNEKLFADITDENVLVDIAVNGKTSPVRQKAAEKISTRENLETVLSTAKEKDKSVVKIVKSKLEVFKAADAEFAKNQAYAAELCERAEQLLNREADEQFQRRLERIETSWQALNEEEKRESSDHYQTVIAACQNKLQARLAAEAALLEQTQEQQQQQAQARQTLLSLTADLSQLASKLYELELIDAERENFFENTLLENNTAAENIKKQGLNVDAEYKAYIRSVESVTQLWQQLQTHGPLAQLVNSLKTEEVGRDPEHGETIKKAINNLLRYKSLVRDEVPDVVAEASAAIADWAKARDEKREKDKKRLKKINELIAKANRAISAGHVRQARGITRELNEKREKHGDLPQNVVTRLEELDQAMAKLGDWHEFAVLPKKQALVEKMEALVDSTMHPNDLAELIKSMQQEWKVLCKGGENPDQELWERLQTAADKAFEPCRKYFDELAAEREQNLAKRGELIEQVSLYLDAYDWDNAVWKDVEHTIRAAREAWQNCWPVPKKKMHSMQKQFDSILEKIHGKVKEAKQTSSEAKRKLVERAEQLAQQEDVTSAINEAKRLQAQWKTLDGTVGANRKEDQKLWKLFRGHCDAIFQKRDAEFAEVNAKRSEELAKAKALLQKLDDILKKTGAEFNEAKKAVKEIKAEYHTVGELPKSEQNKVRESFNKKLEQIDDKGRQERKTAIKASWNALFEVADSVRAYELAVLSGSAADEALADAKDLIEATQNWPTGGQAVIQQRLENASSLSPAKIADSENALRILCIRAEIANNQESPAEDKALRMQYQVQQLQQAFGQKKAADTPETLALEWIAVPGVADPLYSELLKRFNHNR